MGKRIKNYLRMVNQLLQDDSRDIDWNLLKEYHLQQIAFFSHERLVHLIVTMTFAMLTLIAIGICMIKCSLFVIAIVICLLILLIPYIFHYFRLENGVQEMYVQYDEILKRLDKIPF